MSKNLLAAIALSLSMTITVTAQNDQDATTLQYRDAYAKLGANSVTVTATQDDSREFRESRGGS